MSRITNEPRKFNSNIRTLYRKSSFVTRAFALLCGTFALLSMCFPILLTLVGALAVGSVALFNNDVQLHKDFLNRETKKIEELSKLQNELIYLLHQLAGLRANYEKLLEPLDVREKFNRALYVPRVAYIPNFDEIRFKDILSRLSFTSNLVSKNDAVSIHEAPIEKRALSITILMQELLCAKGLLELWRLRNELYDQLNHKPIIDQPELTKIDIQTPKHRQDLQNFIFVSEECLLQLQNVMTYAEAALKYFIPAAQELVDKEARNITSVAPLSGPISDPNFRIEPLSEREKMKISEIRIKSTE